MGFFDLLQTIFEYIILSITIFVLSAYIVLAVISALVLRKYLRANSFVDYNKIIGCPFVPSVSILAPAYNESKTVVESARALLSLFYGEFEVIIINDGSTDDSLEKMIKVYDLEKVDYFINYIIPTQEIRGVYKSLNKSFDRLIVIDKYNGGKADSLNAGINLSKYELFVSMDVDSIIESDALLKLVKPFLEASEDQPCIATGGVIRIVNSCEVEGGQITRIRFPERFLPRFQVLEYTRSFLMARMAWSKLDGLLLVSGALGMFNKEIAIDAGGYYSRTVGEDMEIVVRMRRFMVENKRKYKVAYVPDPLCWTEAPWTLKLLGRQRNRWTRGMIDTLSMHRKIFMNPKYGTFGMLGYAYWFFFEWIVLLVEILGLIFFVFSAMFGNLNWGFFLLLLGFIYSYAIALSMWAILYEELSYHKYEKKSDIFKMVLAALIEPAVFHPLNVYWVLRGNLSYLSGSRDWGDMIRRGFDQMRLLIKSL